MGRTDWPPIEQILSGIYDVLKEILKEMKRHNGIVES